MEWYFRTGRGENISKWREGPQGKVLGWGLTCPTGDPAADRWGQGPG